MRGEVALEGEDADRHHPRAREPLRLGDRPGREPGIALAEAARRGQHLGRVLPVRRGAHDGARPRLGIRRLEDARADEHRLGAERHAERGVGRRRDAAGGEVRHRQAAGLGDAAHQLVGRAERLGVRHALVARRARERAHLAADLPQVAHRLDDVAAAGLALGADHRGALADPPQRLAEVARAADERHAEGVLVDVDARRRPASAPRSRR